MSDSAHSAVSYTSISSAAEFPEMDPDYHMGLPSPPPSPAYVPDPMELEDHVPVYVPEPEHPEYHVPSDDDTQAEDQPYADDISLTAESPGFIADSESMDEDSEDDSIDYPDEPGTDDEDPEEEPSEEREPKDEDTEMEEPSKGFEETESFEEDETAVTPPPRPRQPRISVRPQTLLPASLEARIAEFASAPTPPLLPPSPLSPWSSPLPRIPSPPATIPTYDQVPLGHRATMIHRRDDIPVEDLPPWRRFMLTAPPPGYDVAESSATAARPPRGLYGFVDTIEAGQSLIPGHDTQTITRAADRAGDVGYVRALQASEHRMMTSIEENRELLARLETLETHMSRMKWQRQNTEVSAVIQMMRTRVLEDRARIDTVEDTGSSC
ncbi:hypothetical protein Tco_1229243 [Tanacetum coccineum]